MSRRMTTVAYDNGGKTLDRYTVYIPNAYSGWDRFTMSSNACSPLGVNQYLDTVLAFTETDERVAIHTLPKDVRKAINARKRST